MSGHKTHSAAAAEAPEPGSCRASAGKQNHNKAADKTTTQQMPGSSAPSMCKDFQSPQRRGCSRYTALINGDSPSDVEQSQDIFWDPTSPTSASGALRNTRVVEISDIVNRIAPKDVKQRQAESPLLQWIGDSAVPCTPDVPKPRLRKKYSRQSSVEDLMKLAKQFDENMQQDRETSERLNAANNSLNEASGELTESSVKDVKCPSSADQVEAELHALFDCSTQRVSGRLSQASSASAHSQEVKHQRLTSTSAEPRQSELRSAGQAAHPAEEKESCGFTANDFDDDWENDDIFNDSFVLAMTQDPSHTTRPAANTNPAPSCSALQEVCAKPKTSNRSTFKLQSNPHFQPKMAAKDSRPSVAVLHPNISEQKCAATKTSVPIPIQPSTCQEGSTSALISDSLWDDGDDDALLYQVCDSIENSQPQLASHSHSAASAAAGANRQSQYAFVRSNSLPGTSSETGNYQGWSVTMKGAGGASRMSQSLPGSRVSLGTFNQAGNEDVKPHRVTARHHTAFKRNVSDSAAISSKVFVTSQTTWKCSAAEIERKKQEALARRRLRMQNTPKP